ncbi:alpha/beta hydrolase [Photobacterium damselae]|uniref:Alpha/beta hydrolase n=1 Tax=Photobacterium damselae TaxID=38293 RepID=A0ACD3T096_PHODM|nr:alpha/beta hydrolase [Photobacterium damselae]RDL28344.1 alpha/beta hydrolase [Photobacterium damselae]TMX54053.1 alpha/beta hydrolase [Photobacterium damselae]TMX69718.1 alpha/beta hydrolase [Photobacterium damselae]TMX77306.1 alpha/beta hydrolase [Photobacterium damselae]
MKNLLKSVILCGSLLTSLSGCEIVKWKGQYDTHSLKKQGFSEHSLLLKEGGTLNYWQGGQGEPLLLLHGFGGSASATWLATMQELSKHYYVIAPDLLWFGKSHSLGRSNLTTQTEAIWQLLDHLKVQRVNVAGISYGGFVTYSLMANPEELFVPQDKSGIKKLYDQVFIKSPYIPDFIAEQIYDGYFKDWQPERESLLNTLTADRERLGKISTDTLPKTLLIWGEKDQIFPLENGIALSHYLQAPIVVFPETAHGITNEKPELTAKTIESFLSQVN